MKCLAIETATSACSCALMVGESISETFQLAPREHTTLLLPMIERTLKNADLSLSELDAIAFTHGPGSFTGLRIATGVVQGLAYAVDLPVIPISTLHVFAQGAYRKTNAPAILVALDARMQQVYYAAYQINESGSLQLVGEEYVINPSQVTIDPQIEWLTVGDGWNAYAEEWVRVTRTCTLRQSTYDHPHAQDLLPIAKKRYQQKKWVTANEAIPNYLRNQVVNYE